MVLVELIYVHLALGLKISKTQWGSYIKSRCAIKSDAWWWMMIADVEKLSIHCTGCRDHSDQRTGTAGRVWRRCRRWRRVWPKEASLWPSSEVRLWQQDAAKILSLQSFYTDDWNTSPVNKNYRVTKLDSLQSHFKKCLSTHAESDSLTWWPYSGHQPNNLMFYSSCKQIIKYTIIQCLTLRSFRFRFIWR